MAESDQAQPGMPSARERWPDPTSRIRWPAAVHACGDGRQGSATRAFTLQCARYHEAPPGAPMSGQASPLKDLYPVVDRVRQGAHVASKAEYLKLYERSVKDPAGFWGEQAKAFLTW